VEDFHRLLGVDCMLFPKNCTDILQIMDLIVNAVFKGKVRACRTNMIVANFEKYKTIVQEARRLDKEPPPFRTPKPNLKTAIDNFFTIYEEMNADPTLHAAIIKEFKERGCAPSLGVNPTYAPFRDVSLATRKALPMNRVNVTAVTVPPLRHHISAADEPAQDSIDDNTAALQYQIEQQLTIDVDDSDDVIEPTYSDQVRTAIEVVAETPIAQLLEDDFIKDYVLEEESDDERDVEGDGEFSDDDDDDDDDDDNAL
jgi:hypothetical protein